jgi:hypothetical protein
MYFRAKKLGLLGKLKLKIKVWLSLPVLNVPPGIGLAYAFTGFFSPGRLMILSPALNES